ncbi:MAG: hypothetical protein M3Y20_05270 [Actinomycetota bacterium]|nr:hypothetical protein [Actinomycetota bacterium]
MSAGPGVRFTVGRSVQPLAWGIVLVVIAMVGGQLASQQYVAALVSSGETGVWEAASWVFLLAGVVGVIALILGVVSLAGNVDYLAAREAERHRLEAYEEQRALERQREDRYGAFAGE